MDKPSWNEAPNWANHLAKDGDGKWHWYESEPNWDAGEDEWLTMDRYELVGEPEVNGNGTLDPRP